MDRIEYLNVLKYFPYLITDHSEIVDVNIVFTELSGYSKEELQGKTIEDLKKILKIYSSINLEEIREGYHCNIFTKSSEVREVKVLMEKALEQEERIYVFQEQPNSRINIKFPVIEQLYLENKTGVAIYSAIDMRLLRANQQYLDFLEFPYNIKENSIGREFKEIVNGFEGSEQEKILKEVLTLGKLFRSTENRYDGFERGITYWDLIITPVFEDQKIKYFIHNIVEVTEQVLNREKLTEQNRKVLEETLEFNKLITEFVANISHELRTPLNVILSGLQVLGLYDKENSQEASARRNRYYKIIKQNCCRQLRLVNNLIDVSKIEAGFFELQLENHNIVRLVEDISLSVVEYVEDKGIHLIFDTDVEEKIIACDADAIERILFNLLSNAIKFTNIGDEISITIVDKGNRIGISIQDTGIGIPNDKLAIIFQRFQQVDKSLNRNREGSGIGLYITKSLVEMHGGFISVQSKEGKGSEFYVELPVQIISNNTSVRTDITFERKHEKVYMEFSDIYF